MKCVFESTDCYGNLKEKDYLTERIDNPINNYWIWPKVFSCEYHENLHVGWRDALNTRSNVLVNNRKMTHTKELSDLQGLYFWVGNLEKIIFCPKCNGTGEEGDNMGSPKPCLECNCTGRVK